ncbi:hypothetical protein L3X39_09670 [Sabulilitoribacter multivorans]|uniref:SRPBCC family protein n=1 Tax=Flaviramulus multivorans TaxID=1304750 RepID=A0ABS9IJY2_9FLAO|nr:hypothetical protein [Flaviramulus multivorans]MCF7560902.1 hypothetical protein [Flaviramulus multivorans]
MKVVNIHKRIINQPLVKVTELFKTLATSNDLVWPYENWPAIKFKNGLNVGSKGGHGRIRYTITEYEAGKYIKFKFTKPEGFNGTHTLKINSIHSDKTEISHDIQIRTSFKATFLWVFVIRWLHDALIEEAFDKVENYFLVEKKVTKYNVWVNYLRGVYKRKAVNTKTA